MHGQKLALCKLGSHGSSYHFHLRGSEYNSDFVLAEGSVRIQTGRKEWSRGGGERVHKYVLNIIFDHAQVRERWMQVHTDGATG